MRPQLEVMSSVLPMIETFLFERVDESYSRMLGGKVKLGFVITLRS